MTQTSTQQKTTLVFDEKERSQIPRKVTELSRLFKTYNQATAQIEPVVLSPSQQEIFSTIVKRDHPRVHVMTTTQYGKLVASDTPVWTTKGWKKHGDLVVGDYVFNHNGEAVKVEFVHPKFFANREVTISNGEKIKVHENHEWMIRHHNHRNSKFKIYETKELEKKSFRPKNGSGGFLQLPKVIPFDGQTHSDFDAYTLGLWLGDGVSNKSAISQHPKDFQSIESVPYKVSKIHVHKDTGVYTYSFGFTDFIKHLKKLKLIKNKHIPLVFKVGSVHSKLELLAGLIDSDGYVYNSKRATQEDRRVYITNTNKVLIDDICDVIHSLGMRCSVTKVKATMSSSGIKGKKDVYVIGFNPTFVIPTRLPRKKIVVTEDPRILNITDIQKCDPVEGNCITVEGGMYLVGKSMIPTHNSFTVALATLLRAATKPEKWAIVAPSEAKAKIIMGYIIEHAFDNPFIEDQLLQHEKSERLKSERSKKRITFKGGGEIFILSADTKNKKDAGEALMGFGAPNIILDESSLIPDDIYAKIFRMLGGHADNFILEIGNPFHRNHFIKSYRDPGYKKIVVDWERAVKEGRLQEKFVNEMRDKPFFSVLYECKFPDEDEVDASGWQRLIFDKEIELAFREKSEEPLYGDVKMGVDVNRGGSNESVWVIRNEHKAKIVRKQSVGNLMELCGTTIQLAQKYGVSDFNITLDDTGVGGGAVDRLREQGWDVNGINMSEKAIKDETYINVRAEMYFDAREWLKKGGTLEKDGDWYNLGVIKFKVRDSSGKLKIISKQELAKEGVESPDVADAFMLTFFGGPSEFVNKEQKVKVLKNRNNPESYE